MQQGDRGTREKGEKKERHTLPFSCFQEAEEAATTFPLLEDWAAGTRVGGEDGFPVVREKKRGWTGTGVSHR